MRDATSSHRGQRCVEGGGTEGSGVAAVLGGCVGPEAPGPAHAVLAAVSPLTSPAEPSMVSRQVGQASLLQGCLGSRRASSPGWLSQPTRRARTAPWG